MKIPFSWLKKHVELTKSPAEIADDLVRLGHEVEGVEEPRAAVKGVLVGHILCKEPHPDADKLSLLKVDVGQDAPLAIVCGASNMDAGDKVPVATIGTCLPNGLTIKKGAIRGQTSFGMCCSETELGLADESAGLLILPEDAPVGCEVGEYLGFEEAVIDLSITPNRGDCMNARGIARDLAADGDLKLAEIDDVALAPDGAVSAPSISIDNETDCPLYLGRRIEGVTVQDSPSWMQAGLIMAGMRPVNGIVDVLNYVMLFFGQPMHAFDADKLNGSVSIRSAMKDEPFAALDGRSLKLHAGDLVVSDASDVIALAGIMGSEPSGVTETTTNILLESAFFRPARVSETRRSHAMVSEASMRFERGVDPQMVATAMQQATAMITDLFGGKAGELTVCGSSDNINAGKTVHCSVAKLETRLGVEIPESVDDVLRRMDFGIARSGDKLEVQVPQFRHDISIPEDISEEYARVIGFDAIPEVLPALATTAPARKDTSIHEAVAGGFLQVVTYAFISREEQRLFVDNDGADIELENPISDAMSVMRRSPWPGLLNAAKYNLNRQQAGVALAEQGRTYMRTAKGNSERNVLAWLMTGEVESDAWYGSARSATFFDLKGAVESWLAGRGLTGRFIADDSIQGLQAGQSAKILIGRNEAGRIGRVDGDIAEKFDIDAPVFVADIDLDALHAGKQAKFMALPEFPGVERDLVFLMDRKAFVHGSGNDAILQQVRKAGGKLLTDVSIFDLYEGKGVPEGMISVGVRFTLQDPSRTLTQQDSDATSKAIINAMQKMFSAALRG
ncbi:phenylalanyl-tRNA synthetase beta subunit [Mariprofundus ferrinatatus]|uniref:Phenylalanine--tRNA ligase beta subunit n=1 Tax=Mariprofundus ferrinatatus TaxID=1921087 RepID=A0A2K8L5C9_9PROT|nr:phenylalanine--tRNA ligase subunit beta [Mariprofundus ferrinatatus]ATX82525.1 phenylalanyl-tRNA synthetase beta subunit [Mariprofundus ferrinatatus]